MIILNRFALCIATLSLFSACGSEAPITETGDTPTASEPGDVLTEVQANGLTCEAQQSIQAFDEARSAEFSGLLRDSMSAEQFTGVVEDREINCTASAASSGEIGTVSQAITGSWFAETIEEDYSYSGSWGGSVIYTDGAAFGNMCGSDGDYIVEFDSISGAYANGSSLEVVGLTSDADCMLGWLGRHYVSARVYSDNDIRACVGYWSAVWCGGAPVSGDFWIHD